MRTLPLLPGGRVHRPSVRRQPAGGVPRGGGADRRADAGDRQRDEPLGDDVRAAGRGPAATRRVRIFTPALELPFAGHPSVGTACELVRLRLVDVYEPVTRVVLELGVGPTAVEVSVRGRRAGRGDRASAAAGVPRPGAARLGRRRPRPRPRATCTPSSTPSPVDTGLCYTIIPLASQRALARVSLDLELAGDFERRHAEIYPCAFTGQDEPWVEARGLFPFAGITEDPATGSAAGPLAAYMAREGVLPSRRSAWCSRGPRSAGRASSRWPSPAPRRHHRRARRRLRAARPAGRALPPGLIRTKSVVSGRAARRDRAAAHGLTAP